MSLLVSLSTGQAAQALAWALVHFIWQGAALATAAFVLMHLLRPSASARYAVGVITLMAMLAAPVATFVWIQSSAGVAGVEGAGSLSALPSNGLAVGTVNSQIPSASATTPATFLTVLVLAWLVGVVSLSVRLLGGWLVARRLVVRAVRPVSLDVEMLARRVASSLHLRRAVRIVESSGVSVPVMIGWLKPVVLLPAAALAGLTPSQLEALLAHELAHVRRHDYLVNLLQSFIETLLFYHPAVWWVSRQVRVEREHCCDDLAIGVCDRLVYASALTELASLTTPRLALAATDGSLLRRVRRILAGAEADARPASGWVSLAAVALIAAALMPIGLLSSRGADLPATPSQAVSSNDSASVVLEQSGKEKTPAVMLGAVAPGPVPVVTALQQEVPTTLPVTLTLNPAQAKRLKALLAEARSRLAQVRMTHTETHPDVARARRNVEALELMQANSQRGADGFEVQLEEARKQLIEREKQLEQLRKDRVKLDAEKAESELKTRREATAAQLETLRKRLDEAKQMVAKGVEKPEAVDILGAQIAGIEQEMRRADADMQYKLAVSELEERRIAMEREFEQAQKEFSRHQEEFERQLQESAAADLFSNNEAAKLFENADREFVRRLSAASRQLHEEDAIERSAVVAGSDARVRNHDVIVLSIDGEDALARVYAVDDNGAIRLPLIGAVRVQNLTPSQVEEVIAKQLLERKIGASKNVHVELRRPREK